MNHCQNPALQFRKVVNTADSTFIRNDQIKAFADRNSMFSLTPTVVREGSKRSTMKKKKNDILNLVCLRAVFPAVMLLHLAKLILQMCHQDVVMSYKCTLKGVKFPFTKLKGVLK